MLFSMTSLVLRKSAPPRAAAQMKSRTPDAASNGLSFAGNPASSDVKQQLNRREPAIEWPAI